MALPRNIASVILYARSSVRRPFFILSARTSDTASRAKSRDPACYRIIRWTLDHPFLFNLKEQGV